MVHTGFRCGIGLVVSLYLLALFARGLGTLRADALLAWTSERDGDREIYVWDDGSRQRANLSHHRSWDDNAAWSQDGRLAWVSQRDGNNEIYLWDRERIVNVSDHPSGDS